MKNEKKTIADGWQELASSLSEDDFALSVAKMFFYAGAVYTLALVSTATENKSPRDLRQFFLELSKELQDYQKEPEKQKVH